MKKVRKSVASGKGKGPAIVLSHYDELDISVSPWEESPVEGVMFFVTASINGREMPDVLDVDEFFLSLNKKPQQEARLPIFNCTCGCFGCGGYYVNVLRTPEALVWRNAYTTDLQHRGNDRWRFLFSWDNIREVAGYLLQAITAISSEKPDEPVACGVAGVCLTERMSEYQAIYHSLPGV